LATIGTFANPRASGDYMGEHWLASFALLALLANPGKELAQR
jgi:hypothetical protein